MNGKIRKHAYSKCGNGCGDSEAIQKGGVEGAASS